MKKEGNKRKILKNKKVIEKSVIKNKTLIAIVVGIIIIAVIIYFVVKTETPKKLEPAADKPELNLLVSFEWREPKTITPYGGRFYDKCDDGTNLGKVWANIELKNQEPDLSFTCKATIIVKDTQKIVDAAQLNLGTSRTKSAFIGFTEELTKEHSIEICCKTKIEESSLCKTFELAAYC